MSDDYHREKRGLPTTSSKDLGAPQDSERQTAGLIARLLIHYWTENMSASVRETLALDWIADLREFGPDTLSRACGEWRRTQTKRPTIADIRKLCFEFRQMHQPHHAIVDGRSDPHEAADRYARSAGWSSALERQDAIDARKRAMREAEDWRISERGKAAVHGFQTPAQALGVTAREWSSEEMSEARRQIPGMGE